MEEQIDREFEHPFRNITPDDPSVVRRNTLFIRMLSLSILLHLALTPLIFLPGQRADNVPFSSIIAVNLDTVPTPPATPPPEPPTPTGELSPETPVIPEPVRELVPPQPKTETQSLQEQVATAITNGAKQPDLLEQSSLGLGLSLGYFSSLAEGRTLRDDIKLYYFAVLQKVNEQWWLTGAGKQGRTPQIPVVSIIIARNGDLVNRFVEQSSGDREFDKKILQALDAAAPFPPLPPTFRDTLFKAPIRMVAPLNFLLPSGTEFKGHS